MVVISLSSNQSEQLHALFSVLSEAQRANLVMTIKAAKADGESDLPYDDLLCFLEDKEIEEDRWQILFNTVQPLVVNEAKRCDQIEYGLLQEVWDHYLRELDPVLATAWLSGKEEAGDMRDAICSNYLKLMGTKEGRQSLAARFGKGKLYQLDILFSLLPHAEALEGFFGGWPEQIKSLDDSHLIPLREFNEHLMTQSPEITPYLLYLVTSCLLHPFHVFRAVEKVTGHSNDLVMSKTELKSVGDALLDRNDVWLETFIWPEEQLCDPTLYKKSMKSFIDLTTGWLSEFDVDPSGPWGKRLAGQRAKCGEIWDKHMRRIQKCIEQVMPRKRGRLTGRQTMPDVSKKLGQDKVEAAVNAVSVLVSIQPYASQGGFQAAKDKVVQKLESRLAEQSDDLLAMFGHEDMDYDELSAHFAVLVQITRAYSGNKDADVLARRSVAAMAA